jgi:hypothetical protein
MLAADVTCESKPSYVEQVNLILKFDTEHCNIQKTLSAQKRKTPESSKARGFRWRLSLPHWITSKVIEAAGIRAPCGWSWMLRAYNVIPYRSQAVGCVKLGNLQKLQDLFASRRASPFDQVEDTGLSLLYVSITRSKYTNHRC